MVGAAPHLSIRPGIQLQLTPQLQQALRLLQLSSLELQQEVQQRVLDNPFLELEEAEATAPSTPEKEAVSADISSDTEFNTPDNQSESAQEAPELEALSWEGDSLSTFDWDDAPPGPAPANADSEQALPHDFTASAPSLQAHLQEQASNLRLAPAERAALEFLIGNLLDNGYLDGDLPELAHTLLPEVATEAETPSAAETRQTLMHHLQLALGLLQSMEPAGIGARNVAECLRLQLRHAWAQEAQPAHADHALYQLALALCEQPLPLLARKDVRTLAQHCAAPPERIALALRWIGQLEPNPARRFAAIASSRLIPDVLVRPSGQGLQVQLNPEVLPRLNVHALYAQALRGQRSHASYAGLHSQLQEARWYVKNLAQRFDTILRVAQAIVQEQAGFFKHGPVAMRPLVLREVAQALDLHTSTISRTVNGKYMATPQGTFEFSYFFSSGVQTDTGGSTSSTAVQTVIAQLIAAENPKKPLSDAKIADLLAAQGIECARRTVAKYREALNIPATSLRKTV